MVTSARGIHFFGFPNYICLTLAPLQVLDVGSRGGQVGEGEDHLARRCAVHAETFGPCVLESIKRKHWALGTTTRIRVQFLSTDVGSVPVFNVRLIYPSFSVVP